MDEEEIKRIFGERVRELRRNKSLSQENLALACGLDRTYVGDVERGNRNISLINIYRLAHGLSVSPKTLFEFEQYND